MARWNSDITVYQWVIIGFTAALLIIYSIYITRIVKSLHRNKRKINAFLCSTLVLIGLSIILLQLRAIVCMFFPEIYNSDIIVFINNDLSRGIENVGIVVDIVRLRLILLSQDKEYERTKRNAYIILIVAILIIVIFNTLIGFYLIDRPFFMKILQEKYPQDSPEKIYLKIYETAYLVNTYVVCLSIISAYIAIFIIYRRRVQIITE